MKIDRRAARKTSPLKAVRSCRGRMDGRRGRFAIVAADFNEYFTDKLAEGAVDTLERSGASRARISIFRVPGSLELPLAVRRVLRTGRYDAVIALGVVIRGQTRHFNHVVDGVSEGLLRVSLECDRPVVNGVVAAENLAQAIDRTGGKLGHKGRDAARTALEMVNLLGGLK